MVAEDDIEFNTDLYPSGPYFPMNNAMGLIARRKMRLGQGSGGSQLTMAGAFYAQEEVLSSKQNEIAGTFVSSYYAMNNVPRIYQVPALPDYLPPGMPGSDRIWIKSIRVDSWREI